MAAAVTDWHHLREEIVGASGIGLPSQPQPYCGAKGTHTVTTPAAFFSCIGVKVVECLSLPVVPCSSSVGVVTTRLSPHPA